jgi:hypothetical protein
MNKLEGGMARFEWIDIFSFYFEMGQPGVENGVAIWYYRT